MRDRPAPHKSWGNVIVLLIYFGIAVGITWPLVPHLSTHFPGGSQDTFVHYWNGWWVKRSLAAGQSPYYTSYLYYPTGMDLTYHNFAWISIIPWAMLESVLGKLAAYNLSILINLALCGFGAFLLAYELTNDRRAAFLAGLIYQSWPFRLSQPDHPNLISTQWIPLFMLFLIRTMRQGKWRNAVLTGVFLALTGYTRWQQLIPAAIAGGIYFLCTLPDQYTSWRRWLPALLLAGGIALLALTPPLLLLIEQQRSAPADVVVEDDETNFQTDLMAYITPSRSHPVFESFTQSAYERYYSHRSESRRFAAYVGVTTLALAVLGVWKTRRSSLPWVAIALGLILLALGPILRINGQTYPGVPMPYRLAARLYVPRLMRVPDRFNMFLALPVAMLAACGVPYLLTYVQQRSRRRDHWISLALSCLLGGMILFEYLPVPFPLRHPQISAFYHQLSVEPGDFAVLNLPKSALDSKRYMLAQVTHQHPILQGKTPRFPQGTFDYLNTNPWLQALRESSTMPPQHTDVSRQLTVLAQDDVRYVILHKDASHPLRLAQWRHYFLISPHFEDEQIVVYPTAPLAGRDFTLMHELAPGIGPILVNTSNDCLPPAHPLMVDVGWGTTAPPGQALDVKLGLVSVEGTVRHEQVFPLSVDWPTQEWPANAAVWGYYELNPLPALPNELYTISLALVDPTTGTAQGPDVSVGQVTVNESACVLPIPSDAVRVDALFGRELRLLGYQLRRDQDQLTVTLHWRSERLMETDYKVFVHIYDPGSGLRVAQDDSMPLRWAYPTTYWSSGKVIADDIPLSLENAPAGVYRIIVGVYDSKTGARLRVLDSTGQPQPDGQMILPEGTIKVDAYGS